MVLLIWGGSWLGPRDLGVDRDSVSLSDDYLSHIVSRDRELAWSFVC